MSSISVDRVAQSHPGRLTAIHPYHAIGVATGQAGQRLPEQYFQDRQQKANMYQDKYIYLQQVIRVKKLMHGAADSCTRITWASFVHSEEPMLKLLPLSELQLMNSSPISNCLHLKSAILFLCNINYNINSLLQLHIGTNGRTLHTGSQNENNIKRHNIICIYQAVNKQ